jgi:hypothetical protein
MQPLEFIFKETTRGVASQKPVLLADADNFFLLNYFWDIRAVLRFFKVERPHMYTSFYMIRYYGDMLKIMHPKNEEHERGKKKTDLDGGTIPVLFFRSGIS